MEAANNKRIKSVFLSPWTAVFRHTSSPETVEIVVKILSNLVNFREITDNSVNDEMTE